MAVPLISILLSTFNGERYLAAQLESIWAQTLQDYEVLIRDDGSTDKTLAMLQAASSERPDRVRLIGDNLGRLGPAASFGELMKRTSAPYVAFCDQDDSWMPEKLERSYQAMRREEAASSNEIPVLVCSDASIADAHLHVTGPSYFAMHRFSFPRPRDLSLSRLIFTNCAIGATTMMNAALVARCKEVPKVAIMHDWWCVLVARATGRIAVLSEPLVLYRQHGANVIGLNAMRLPRNLREARETLRLAQAATTRCIRQAQLVNTAFASNLTEESRSVLSRFANFGSKSAIGKVWTIVRTGAFRTGPLINLAHLFACMTAKV